ncbi:MAG TPA: hypothetical protein VF263_18110 [Longimicrobiaceae bacterium]
MKRTLFSVLCLAVVAMGGTRLSATESDAIIGDAEPSDYRVCMDYCMAEYGFAYCHGECKGVASTE